MPLLQSCCCWTDLKIGSGVAGAFTLTASAVQLLVEIQLWIVHEDLLTSLSGQTNKDVLFIRVLFAIMTGFDAFMALFSSIMLFGVHKGYRRRQVFIPWLLFLPVYGLYELGFYIAVIVTSTHNLPHLNDQWYHFLPVVVYGIIKFICLFVAFIVIVSRFQEILESVVLRKLPVTYKDAGHHVKKISRVHNSRRHAAQLYNYEPNIKHQEHHAYPY